jgi:hypothetical protein
MTVKTTADKGMKRLAVVQGIMPLSLMPSYAEWGLWPTTPLSISISNYKISASHAQVF